MKKRVIILISIIVVLVILSLVFFKTRKEMYYSLLERLDETRKIVATFRIYPEDDIIINGEYETYEIEVTDDDKILGIVNIIKSSIYDEYLGELVTVLSDTEDVGDIFELEFFDSEDDVILTVSVYTDCIGFNRYKGLYSNENDNETIINLIIE